MVSIYIYLTTAVLFYLLTVPLAIEQNLLPQYSVCLAALQNPSYKLMFGYFLRNESGRGDTIDRFSDYILLC